MIKGEIKGGEGAGSAAVTVGEGVDGGELVMENASEEDGVSEKARIIEPRKEVIDGGGNNAWRSGIINNFVGGGFDMNGVLAKLTTAGFIEEAGGNDLMELQNVG